MEADGLSGWALIQQGAEGKVYSGTLYERSAIAKERIPKTYRLAELDTQLRKKRLVQEVRCMLKCRKAGVDTPCLFFVDEVKCRIFMEQIQGHSVKHFLRTVISDRSTYPQEAYDAAAKIGEALGKMHDADVCHGDLTTSNMMIREDSQSIVLIDFGLASSQVLVEDKAVDLYVMEKAFLSTHASSQPLIDAVLKAYRKTSKSSKETMTRLEKVRARGRKRSMVG